MEIFTCGAGRRRRPIENFDEIISFCTLKNDKIFFRDFGGLQPDAPATPLPPTPTSSIAMPGGQEGKCPTPLPTAVNLALPSL